MVLHYHIEVLVLQVEGMLLERCCNMEPGPHNLTLLLEINVIMLTFFKVPGATGNFVFIKDSVFRKPDISSLPFPMYFAPEDEDSPELEPLVANLGDTNPFMAAD